MTQSKQQRMQLFLEKNYTTLSELANYWNVSEAEILKLETTQCIPGHTYEMRQMVIFSCAGIYRSRMKKRKSSCHEGSFMIKYTHGKKIIIRRAA